VVPLTWTQVLTSLRALPALISERSNGDPWLVGQYAPVVKSATEELERALKGAASVR
jgi:hypothetical protein